MATFKAVSGADADEHANEGGVPGGEHGGAPVRSLRSKMNDKGLVTQFDVTFVTDRPKKLKLEFLSYTHPMTGKSTLKLGKIDPLLKENHPELKEGLELVQIEGVNVWDSSLERDRALKGKLTTPLNLTFKPMPSVELTISHLKSEVVRLTRENQEARRYTAKLEAEAEHSAGQDGVGTHGLGAARGLAADAVEAASATDDTAARDANASNAALAMRNAEMWAELQEKRWALRQKDLELELANEQKAEAVGELEQLRGVVLQSESSRHLERKQNEQRLRDFGLVDDSSDDEGEAGEESRALAAMRARCEGVEKMNAHLSSEVQRLKDVVLSQSEMRRMTSTILAEKKELEEVNEQLLTELERMHREATRGF